MINGIRTLDFIKMHGAGNDYVYVDATGHLSPLAKSENLSQLARAVSDRHFGIGGDGLVLITYSETADFGMRMFNADGSEAQMCGNATRCVGKYLADSGKITADEMSLQTAAGIKYLNFKRDETGCVSSVRVDMGQPILTPEDIPALHEGSVMKERPVQIEGEIFRITGVSMGNPHGVIFVDHITDEHINHFGPLLEHSSIWPQKANIEFIEVLTPTRLRMRVWERGTGETLACGTGACAAAVAAHITGRAERKTDIILSGGTLTIEWDKDSDRVFMTGPAEIIAKGTYFLPSNMKL